MRESAWAQSKPGRQTITRIPPYRPGDWVKVKRDAPEGLASKVLQVRSLTCGIVKADALGVWRVHFVDGRCVEWKMVERFATADEVQKIERA